MKAVFKGVLTINFTENKSKLDFESIKNYLIENKLLVNIDFDEILPPIEALINNLIEKNVTSEEKFRECLEEYAFLEEQDVLDIMKVWNQEKNEVFSYILKKHLSNKSLEKLDWSINMQTYSRRSKNIKNLSHLFSLKLKESDSKKISYIDFEMNGSELNDFYKDLSDIDARLDEILFKKS